MPVEDPNPRPPDDNSWIPGTRGWLDREIMLFIANHTPKCTEVIRLLSERMDRKLPPWTRIKLWLHHAICCYCHRYEEHLDQIRKYAGEFPEQIGMASGESLPADAKDRLKRALEESKPGEPVVREAGASRAIPL